ncbi:unnamed protein product [Allacma fusca]|uniref:ubiquitinyl hydrolase 1 n=1 Tax=Allacma fusca TaxID=39272 RepID=A0A8J2KRH9_9HEXA|nr:unnamed protein product [Allacma fusca]
MSLPWCNPRFTEKTIEAMLLSDEVSDDEGQVKVDSSVDHHVDITADPSRLEQISLEGETGKPQEVPDIVIEADYYENSSSWDANQEHWQSGSVEATYSASPSPKERCRREPGVMGLINIGNTCFMNAALQCLLNTPALVEFFLQPKPAFVKCAGFKPVLLYQVYSVFCRAWRTNITAFELRSFKECLASSYPQFHDSRQHDSQEFLALLLDLLHEQLQQCQVSSAAQKQFLEEALQNDRTNQEGAAEVRRSLSYSGRIGCPPKSASPELRKKSRTSPTKRTSRNHGHCPRKRPRMNTTLEAKRKLDFKADNLDQSGDYIERSSPMNETSANFRMKQTHAQSEHVCSVVKEIDHNQHFVKESQNQQLLDSASEFWSEHIKSNNTVIARTFQGFLKSTVTCTACSYVSTVFEPFMYFSLPLPDVGSTCRVLTLRLIRLNEYPIQCVPVTNSYELKSTVRTLKIEIATLVSAKSSVPVNPEKFYLGSVCDFTITELCDDLQVQNIDDHSILYLYELNTNFDLILPAIKVHPKEGNWESLATTSTEVSGTGKADSSDGGYESSPTESKGMESPEEVLPYHVSSTPDSPGLAGTNSPVGNEEHWQVMQCRICYEKCQLSGMLQHSAGCVFCKDCVQKLDEHTPCLDKSFKCPTPQCSLVVRLSDFHVYAPDISGATLAQVTFRNESESKVTTFGHPIIVSIRTCLPAKEFHTFMDSVNPFPEIPFLVYSSTRDGKCCAICDDIQCRGCTFPVVGNAYVRHGSQIVILYTELDPMLMEKFHAGDMPHESAKYYHQDSSPRSYYRYEARLDIHDCLKEFAKEELLDEDNHWLCPSCNCNKRATKKLSVCKFPDYLIIYLKRFVYENLTSQKLENEVTFPLMDLDLNDYMAEEVQGENKWKYDLYGCVSHSGTVSYGHYTAFTKNALSQEWNYFNDRSAYNQNMTESCYSTAYILFYAKRGAVADIPDPLTYCRTSPVSTPPSPGVRTGSSCSMSLASSSLDPFRGCDRSRHSSSQTQRSEEDYRTCASSPSTESLDRFIDEFRKRSPPLEDCKHHIRWTQNSEDIDDPSTTPDSIPPLADY